MSFISKNKIKNFFYSWKPMRKAGYLLEHLHDPLFKEVEIETISACNRECGYCPVALHPRPVKKMEEALFNKIVADLKGIGYRGAFFFCFYSEPLLDKRLPGFLRHVRRELPRATIEIYTNGDLLTFEGFAALVDGGADFIKISQHDPAPSEGFAAMLAAVRASRYARNLVIFERSEEFDLSNRGGLVDVKIPRTATFCSYKRLTIDVEGNVVLCCTDYFSKHRFGNAATENIMDIWNRKDYLDVRRHYWAGLWPYEICRICSGDAAPTEGTKG